MFQSTPLNHQLLTILLFHCFVLDQILGHNESNSATHKKAKFSVKNSAKFQWIRPISNWFAPLSTRDPLLHMQIVFDSRIVPLQLSCHWGVLLFKYGGRTHYSHMYRYELHIIHHGLGANASNFPAPPIIFFIKFLLVFGVCLRALSFLTFLNGFKSLQTPCSKCCRLYAFSKTIPLKSLKVAFAELGVILVIVKNIRFAPQIVQPIGHRLPTIVLQIDPHCHFIKTFIGFSADKDDYHSTSAPLQARVAGRREHPWTLKRMKRRTKSNKFYISCIS